MLLVDVGCVLFACVVWGLWWEGQGVRGIARQLDTIRDSGCRIPDLRAESGFIFLSSGYLDLVFRARQPVPPRYNHPTPFHPTTLFARSPPASL